MSADEWSRQIDLYLQNDIPEYVSVMMRTITMQGLRGLVLKTPVDTGRARGNWQVTIGAAATSSPLGTDSGGSSTIARGNEVISQITLRNPYVLAIVQNNVVYIEELEKGHSTQAPKGMLTLTLAEIESQFA